MGCLNRDVGFDHWFGNIHLSGPCNRACYFCIGQHMMGLDSFNTLDSWPLPGIEDFVGGCRDRGVTEVNVTGTNTDPLLYRHTGQLSGFLREAIPGLTLGLRTNGVLALRRPDVWSAYGKASITVCSFDPVIYRTMMGRGAPPNLRRILELPNGPQAVKLNVVLGPENTATEDVFRTLNVADSCGIARVNLREPYGQPHVGDPLQSYTPVKMTHGMPTYLWGDTEVTYWDVHYVEVESINLYASGNVSTTYPITLGYSPDLGEVQEQKEFPGGRIRNQWQGTCRD
jgi:hypothetical protein